MPLPGFVSRSCLCKACLEMYVCYLLRDLPPVYVRRNLAQVRSAPGFLRRRNNVSSFQHIVHGIKYRPCYIIFQILAFMVLTSRSHNPILICQCQRLSESRLRTLIAVRPYCRSVPRLAGIAAAWDRNKPVTRAHTHHQLGFASAQQPVDDPQGYCTGRYGQFSRHQTDFDASFAQRLCAHCTNPGVWASGSEIVSGYHRKEMDCTRTTHWRRRAQEL